MRTLKTTLPFLLGFLSTGIITMLAAAAPSKAYVPHGAKATVPYVGYTRHPSADWTLKPNNKKETESFISASQGPVYLFADSAFLITDFKETHPKIAIAVTVAIKDPKEARRISDIFACDLKQHLLSLGFSVLDRSKVALAIAETEFATGELDFLRLTEEQKSKLGKDYGAKALLLVNVSLKEAKIGEERRYSHTLRGQGGGNRRNRPQYKEIYAILGAYTSSTYGVRAQLFDLPTSKDGDKEKYSYRVLLSANYQQPMPAVDPSFPRNESATEDYRVERGGTSGLPSIQPILRGITRKPKEN